jgi:hypothetical protein
MVFVPVAAAAVCSIHGDPFLRYLARKVWSVKR